MKTKNIIKYFIFFLIVIFIVSIKTISYSAYNFQSFNNAPRMKIEVNDKKYDDVKIIISDYSGLNSDNIVFYSANNGVKGEQITNKNFIKKIDTVKNKETNIIEKYIYTVSNEYLGNKTNNFYITISDANNSDCSLKTFFSIKAKDNKYVVDYAPRVFNWKSDNKKISFSVKDLAGINYIKLYDMNSDKQASEVISHSDLKKGESTISFELNKFNKINEKYKIKIATADNSKAKQTAIRVVEFSVNPEVKEIKIESSTNTIVESEIDNSFEENNKNTIIETEIDSDFEEFNENTSTEDETNNNSEEINDNSIIEEDIDNNFEENTSLSSFESTNGLINKFEFDDGFLYIIRWFGLGKKEKYTGWYPSNYNRQYYYKNGIKYTGIIYDGGEPLFILLGKPGTAVYNNIYYKNGRIGTGPYFNTYYVNGKPAQNWYKNMYFKNGKIVLQSDYIDVSSLYTYTGKNINPSLSETPSVLSANSPLLACLSSSLASSLCSILETPIHLIDFNIV